MLQVTITTLSDSVAMRSAAVASLTLLLSASSLFAQELPAVSWMLEGFERANGRSDPRSPSIGPVEWVGRTLIYAQDYPAERTDSVLDGLVRIVRESRSANARNAAVVHLTTRGRADNGLDPIPGIFPRLEALYEDIEDRRDKGAAVHILQQAPFLSAERAQILRLLERALAAGPEGPNYEQPYTAALLSLEQMGLEGREVLCRVIRQCSSR